MSAPPASVSERSPAADTASPRVGDDEMLTNDDAALVKALTPTVELAIRQSVRRDPQPLADAIFPVIGPAIRKAIAAAIGGLIESMNHAAELAFSPRALRWRVEAWRTGQSFGEVVIAHRLRYSVEQIFLIQRDSGLLLAHVTRNDAVAPDVVSGMLTAIQEFVRESFSLTRDDALHTLQAGELTVLIEQGPVAAVAAVVRGYAPRAAALGLQQLMEAMHEDFGESVKSYRGDPTSVTGLELRLRDGLVAELSPLPRRRWRLLPMAAMLVIVVAGAIVWTLRARSARARWDSYVNRLSALPGLVVVESGRRDGRWFISGLRDPLAANPASLLASVGISPDVVDAHWQPYLALDPRLVVARARSLLAPPATVTLSATDSGVRATGVAPHEWVVQAERASKLLGVPVDVHGLRDADAEAVEGEARRIAGMRVRFPTGSARPTAEGLSVADAVAERLAKLLVAARAIDATIEVAAVGRTDETGTEAGNAVLAAARSAYLQRRLAAIGVTSRSVAQQARGSDGLRARAAPDALNDADARSASILIEVRRADR